MQLYSPRRPLVDVAEVFLWLMAVGTILCASYWSAWSAREAAIEQDKILKVLTFYHLRTNSQIFTRVDETYNLILILINNNNNVVESWQDASDEYLNTESCRSSAVVDINTTSAVLFVVIASCFLVMLYKLMSYWFIEVLVVLFAIGGVEVCVCVFFTK